MKILVFSKHFWPEKFRINLVVKNLSIQNDITVITSKPYYGFKRTPLEFKKNFFFKKRFGKVNVFYVPSFFNYSKSSFFLFLNYILYISLSTFLIFRIRNLSFNLIFCYGTSPIFQAIPAIIFSKIKKIPLFLWVQDLWPDVLKDTGYVNNKYLLNFINVLVKFIYNYSTVILVQSEEFKKDIKKKLSNNNIFVLYNPESKLNIKKTNIKKNNFFNVFFAGNIGRAQSIETIIELSKKIKIKDRIKIYIYGSGSKKNFLLSEIKKNNLERILIYKGSVSEKQIDFKLLKADAFLLCLSKGTGLSKTLPARLQTYMKFKKPILAAADGSLKNFIIKHKIGYACSTGNFLQLYNNILTAKRFSGNKKKKIATQVQKVFLDLFEINQWVKKLNMLFLNYK